MARVTCVPLVGRALAVREDIEVTNQQSSRDVVERELHLAVPRLKHLKVPMSAIRTTFRFVRLLSLKPEARRAHAGLFWAGLARLSVASGRQRSRAVASGRESRGMFLAATLQIIDFVFATW